MLVIKEEKFQIKVGPEVFSVEYPSFAEAQEISKDFQEKSGEEATDLMISWLKKLGLEEKFFELKPIKAKHIIEIWKEVNSIKK